MHQFNKFKTMEQPIETTKPVKQPRKRQPKKTVEESVASVDIPSTEPAQVPEKKPRKRPVKKIEPEPIADLPVDETKPKSKPKTEKKPRKPVAKKPLTITEPELTIEPSIVALADEPVRITEPSILKTHRLHYTEKIEFIKNVLSVLSNHNVVPMDQVALITTFLESNELDELKSNREVQLENEMEEYVITTVKYKHTNDQIYLKDDDGNLYTIDSPHSFVLNLYDSP